LNKDEFFAELKDNLTKRITELSEQMSENEGYENALFSEDAARGLAFIELCMRRFDVIVMNPPFGEGSEASSPYLDKNYEAWCKNLVCAFFDRMQEMLSEGGKLGAIFDRTVMIKSSYEAFRRKNLCGYISACADTGWEVLEASVETSTFIIEKEVIKNNGIFIDILDTSQKDKELLIRVQNINKGIKERKAYYASSEEFAYLPNSIIGYYFDNDVLHTFQNPNIEKRGFYAMQGIGFVSPIHFRLFYEVIDASNFKLMFNGSNYSLFYCCYYDCTSWEKNGQNVKAHKSYRSSNLNSQFNAGVCYGERGDILDMQIFKKDMFFTKEGLAITEPNKTNSLALNSMFNSIYGQFFLNLYSGQHKWTGYTNLLPMPDYETRQEEIEHIVNEIIKIKRHWFSLDETNLEYHGLIGQLGITNNLNEAFDRMQEMLSDDYERYQELVKANDDLWMDLAEIDRDCDFRQTLNDYKPRRPYEELLSIDKASDKNMIIRKTLTSEILQELVGIVFARWDMAYASGEATIPEFGDVFDPLPFMPVVEYKGYNTGVKIEKPKP
ncbi:MAG: N-6 DNA methylase, partial [Muribaculaceae bacterium]|nr:N-6 DNA methylase [Muribaculaceae bacterium]